MLTRRVYKPEGWKWMVTMGLVKKETEGGKEIKIKEAVVAAFYYNVKLKVKISNAAFRLVD